MVNKKVVLGLLGVLVVSLFAYLVIGAVYDPYVYSIAGIGSGPSLFNPDGGVVAQKINISGTYNLTVALHGYPEGSLLADSQYTNVTIMWALRSNNSFMKNITISNFSGGAFGCLPTTAGPNWNCTNRTYFNTSFDTSGIFDGVYNLTIIVYNSTGGHGATYYSIENSSVANNITIDNTPPNVSMNGHYFSVNYSGGAYFTDEAAVNMKLNVTGGVIQINLSLNDSTTFTKSVIFGINNTRNGTQFNVSPSLSGFVYTYDLILSELNLDASYFVHVYVNDTLDNNNNSIQNISFLYDNVAPNVSIGGGAGRAGVLGNITNGANISAGVSAVAANFLLPLNVTINDTTNVRNDVESVKFNLSNSSGVIATWNATQNGSYWNVTAPLAWETTPFLSVAGGKLNISYLAEGLYHLTVWANDSLGNINYTENFTFRVDRTFPTVAVTCDSPVEVGETVDCTCEASDGGSGLEIDARFPNSLTSESTTTDSAGSFTSSACEARDYAGQTTTATGGWTVNEITATSSGSTGSGGGSSSGAAGNFEKAVWTSINAGEVATVDVDNGEIGVTEVSFKVDATVWGAWVSVNKRDSLPSSVKSTGGEIYRRIEITKGPALKDELMKDTTIDFKVAKSWISENSIGKNDVVLLRYNNNKWTELATTVGEDDGTYIHYSATTPGFSYFVIGTVGAAEPAEKMVGEAEVGEEAAGGEVAEGEAEEVGEVIAGVSNTGLTTIVIVIVVAGILAVLWYVYKRRS